MAPLKVRLLMRGRSWGDVRSVWRVLDEAARVLCPESYPRVCVGVTVVRPDAMAALNEQHRAMAKPTDVLAFPFHSPDSLVQERTHEVQDLGDIVICPAYIAAQCREAGWSLSHRIPAVLVHGMCHLAGHTHYSAEKASEMFAAEEKILLNFAAKYGLGNTYSEMYSPLTAPLVKDMQDKTFI